MIKLLLTGIWGVLLLSGSLYFFHVGDAADQDKNADSGEPFFGRLETIPLNTMSVVFIQKNRVQGYLIIDAAFVVDSAKNKKLSIPANLIVQNAINNAFLKNDDININRLDDFDANEIQLKLAEEVNEKVGEMLVSEVLIQRVDFLTAQDVRDNKLRGG